MVSVADPPLFIICYVIFLRFVSTCLIAWKIYSKQLVCNSRSVMACASVGYTPITNFTGLWSLPANWSTKWWSIMQRMLPYLLCRKLKSEVEVIHHLLEKKQFVTRFVDSTEIINGESTPLSSTSSPLVSVSWYPQISEQLLKSPTIM